MPRKTTRNAQGAGTIRQRKDGRWECRITVGRNPGTGKQVQKSYYAPTQKELVARMKQVQADLENGEYTEPSKLTVGAWLDTWAAEFLVDIKESSQVSYKTHIKKHIKPALGAVLLQKLTPTMIQKFYNKLSKDGKSPKTVKNIHGTLHGALERAVKVGHIRSNPTTVCTRPRVVRKEVQVMDDEAVAAFLKAILGHPFEAIYFIDLFTGLRQGEILGLTWDAVDMDAGTILIDRQLVRSATDGRYFLDTPKHSKVRKITPAPVVMEKLRSRKAQQAAAQLRAGRAWSNPLNLVFTNDLGHHLVHCTVRRQYKQIVAALGYPDLTFHSLRHSYAVISLMSGDDPKTVQENLGHHTAAFTLDTYGHVTEKMKDASAQRMEQYIQNIAKA